MTPVDFFSHLKDLKSLNLKDETLASYSSDSMSTAASLGIFQIRNLEGKCVAGGG